MKPRTNAKIISSFHFEFYTMFNTNVMCSGGSYTVPCISSQELVKVNYSNLCARFWATSNAVPTMNQLPRLAPNVCRSHQNATDGLL